MKTHFDPITIIITMGIIQGYFFSLLFLTINKGNKTANKILSVLLFAISTSIISSVLIFTNLYHYFPHFIRLEMLLTFLFPSLLYLYVKALTVKKFRLTIKDTIHIFPFIFVLISLFPFFIKDGSFKIEYLNSMLKGKVNYLNVILDSILSIIEWIYIYFIFKRIKTHYKSIKQNFSSIEKIDLKWIKIFTILFTISLIYAQILTILVLFFNFSYIIFYKQLTLFVAIAISYLGYRGLIQNDIFKRLEPNITDPKSIIKQIVNFIEMEKIYKKNDFKITDLEEELNIPRETIADVVSEYSGKNFYDFLNIYRIRESKKYLLKSDPKNISTVHINAGFKSEILFNRIFKENTNLTPLQFIQNNISKKPKKTSLNIGVFINSLNNSFCTSILQGAYIFSQKHEINLICFNGGSFNHPEYNTSQKTKIYNLADLNNLDGIISVSVLLGEFIKKSELLDFYSQFKNIPIVSIGMEIEGVSSFKINNSKGLKELLIHLIEDHNYKRIAYINGYENNPDAIERFEAYKKTLKEHNIQFDPQLVTPGSFKGTSGKKAVEILLDERKVKFDIIFAANDYMAISAIEELENRGIRVPEDTAVVGFDNVIESRYITNPLTTVTQPSFELGYKSAEKIYRIINNNDNIENIILDTGFIKRVSCGCKNNKYSNNNNLKKKYEKDYFNITNINNNIIPEITKLIKSNYGTINNIRLILNWAAQITLLLFNKITNHKKENFLGFLKNIITESTTYNIDILLWKSIINIIFNKIEIYHKNKTKINELNDIKNNAYNIINIINNQIKESIILSNYEQSMKLYLINQALLSVNDMESFQSVLIKELPKTNINTFYLSIYDNKDNKDFSRILVAFKNQKPIFFNDEENIFPTKELIPGGLKNKEGTCYIIMSLYFDNEELGFVIFESGINNKSEYELLLMSLSSTVKNILLNDNLNMEKSSNKNSEKLSNKKYEKLNITNIKAKKIYLKLINFLENKKIHINPDLTLPDLAEELSIPRNHLSFIINKYIGLNFYDFINKYRVEEAKSYLIKSKNINMLEIAFDSGFKSKSTFNKIFKKQTKITPTEFRKKFYNLKN